MLERTATEPPIGPTVLTTFLANSAPMVADAATLARPSFSFSPYMYTRYAKPKWLCRNLASGAHPSSSK